MIARFINVVCFFKTVIIVLTGAKGMHVLRDKRS